MTEPLPWGRTHGLPPYQTVFVHGGPGAPGSLGALARDISRLAGNAGIAEPWQSATTVDGQIEELANQIRYHAAPPVRLVGHSWGGMLGWLLAARHPDLVRQLVLLASGPMLPEYATGILQTRLDRLSDADQARVHDSRALLTTGTATPGHLARYAALMKRADIIDPALDVDDDLDAPPVQPDINQAVWNDFKPLRESGAFLAEHARITCGVLVLHGDADAHPLAGVLDVLMRTMAPGQVSAWVYEDCGHYPWLERDHRDDCLDMLAMLAKPAED